MERSPLFDAAAILSERGIIVRISRELGILQPTVSHIFHGKRRATLAQAIKLETFFINNGVPLTRWDLLFYVPKGMTLKEYVASRITGEKEDLRERGSESLESENKNLKALIQKIKMHCEEEKQYSSIMGSGAYGSILRIINTERER